MLPESAAVSHPFRAAVEARSHADMVAALAPDVEFLSPVSFKPTIGRDAVAVLFSILLGAFEEFDYVEEVAEGPRVWLRFRGRVGGREVDGVDLLHTGPDGLIDRFAVMVRPLSATVALLEQVRPKLEELSPREEA